MPDEPARDALGCYGLGLAGLPGAAAHLGRPEPAAPLVRIVRDDAEPPRARLRIEADTALLPLSDGASWATLDRERGEVRLALTRRYRDDELLHPLLSGSCAVFNWWHGRDAFHAGGFVVGGRAWAVLGDKGFGKSTLLAYLASAGVEILSDDLVVESDGDVLPGPAFVDLRSDAAERLGIGRDLGVLGARPRHRLEVPKSVRRPLAGWINLAWDERPQLAPVPLEQRLPRLFANRAVLLQPAAPQRFAYYASLPFFEFGRPKDWSKLAQTTDVLLAALAG